MFQKNYVRIETDIEKGGDCAGKPYYCSHKGGHKMF